MKLTGFTKKILTVTLIPLVYFAGGCDSRIDLAQVQKFAKVAENYETKYEEIVKDIYLSCLRAAQYKTPSPGDVEAVLSVRTEAQQECLQYGHFEPMLLQYHGILAKYTKAVRTLSSDELIDELDGAGQVAESLLGLPIPLPGFEEAANILNPIVTRLANAIERAIQNQYRTEVLEESIEEINSDIQLFIVNLAKITDEIYSDRLFQEVRNMEQYYRATTQGRALRSDVSECGGDKSDKSISREVCILQLNTKLTALLVDRQWKEEQESVQITQKLSEAHSFINTMKNMANLHQELYNSLQ